MAKYTTLNSLFTAVADAIRAKKGTSEPIIADNFPDEIAGIETGITPSGTVNITSNGTHNVTNYANAKVAVPVPEGYADVSGVTAKAYDVRANKVIVLADGREVSGSYLPYFVGLMSTNSFRTYVLDSHRMIIMISKIGVTEADYKTQLRDRFLLTMVPGYSLPQRDAYNSTASPMISYLLTEVVKTSDGIWQLLYNSATEYETINGVASFGSFSSVGSTLGTLTVVPDVSVYISYNQGAGLLWEFTPSITSSGFYFIDDISSNDSYTVHMYGVD